MSAIDTDKAMTAAAPLREAARPEVSAELRKAASEFEALFINEMLKTMRNTVMKSGLFDGGQSEKIYTSMLDYELSRHVASSGGGIGLAEILAEQIAEQAGALAATGTARPADAEPGAVKAAVESEKTAPGKTAEADALKTAEENGRRRWLEKLARIADAIGIERLSTIRFPVKGWVSSGFGPRKDPISGAERMHHGMDIAARMGSDIFPVAPGRVVFSGRMRGYGNVVEVDHGEGFVTRYAHTEKNLVNEGDMVKSSEPIAHVGSSGRSTGPHLHLEARKDGRILDPSVLFEG